MNVIIALEQNALFLYLSVAILGLLVGSFLNVVAYRTPIMLQKSWRRECLDFLEQDNPEEDQEVFNLSHPRSRCPSCNHAISAIENIPVIS